MTARCNRGGPTVVDGVVAHGRRVAGRLLVRLRSSRPLVRSVGFSGNDGGGALKSHGSLSVIRAVGRVLPKFMKHSRMLLGDKSILGVNRDALEKRGLDDLLGGSAIPNVVLSDGAFSTTNLLNGRKVDARGSNVLFDDTAGPEKAHTWSAGAVADVTLLGHHVKFAARERQGRGLGRGAKRDGDILLTHDEGESDGGMWK